MAFVNQMLENIKKLGAYLLIGLLTLLMGAYAFVDQSATIATRQSLLSGAGPGSFADETITWKVFYNYYGYCKNQEERYLAQLGDIDPNMPIFAGIKAENCVRRMLDGVYSLKYLGEEFHLDVTTESIKRDLAKQARELAASQRVIHEDEKLSPQDFYRRLMNQASFEVRKLEKIADQTRRLLPKRVLLPPALFQAEGMPKRIVFQIRLIRWDNESLLNRLKSKIQPSEDELQKRYKTEQAKLEPKNQSPFHKERPFLIERMKAEEARNKLAEIKQKLAKIKAGFRLEEIQKITGEPILQASKVSLSSLDSIKTKAGHINLDQPKFYQSLRKPGKASYAAGPFLDGSYTIYAEIRGLEILPARPESPNKHQKQIQEKSQNLGEEIGREIRSDLLKAASKKGALQLKIETEKKSN